MCRTLCVKGDDPAALLLLLELAATHFLLLAGSVRELETALKSRRCEEEI
eukprot:m.445851 g.445851  ORF g.445851 m.445851 type:complete len:50 (-) comp56859_c0_seq12:905-1054(-)